MTRAAILDLLLADPTRAATMARTEAAALAVDLARVLEALRLHALAGLAAPEAAAVSDAPLTVEEVMRLTGLPRRSVYARAHDRTGRPDWRPFVLRGGRKTLHFRTEFRAHLARRRTG